MASDLFFQTTFIFVEEHPTPIALDDSNTPFFFLLFVVQKYFSSLN
jgi:hypothetical protein